MKLCVATYFTKAWVYSVESWLDHVQAALYGVSGDMVVSTDRSEECLQKYEKIKEKMKGWDVHLCRNDVPDDRQIVYGETAQFIISKIQGAAFSKARALGAELFWSVESDVLASPNSFKVLKQALEFDEGFYDVAMATYFNGQFLGGRGTPQNHICPDIYDEERIIPRQLQKKIKELKKKKLDEKEFRKLDAEVKACPPRGNIFYLQSKKWRRRGWLEMAYPGIGRGAILPTDWVGLGCTLLSKKALSLATYDGYEMRGTQDLFLCWARWHPNGLRMCVLPHAPCSHVKRVVRDGLRSDEIVIHRAYHEPDGEFAGHLRCETTKYYSPTNDFNPPG